MTLNKEPYFNGFFYYSVLDPQIACDSSLDHCKLSSKIGYVEKHTLWEAILKIDGFSEQFDINGLIDWLEENFQGHYIILEFKSKIIKSSNEERFERENEILDHWQIRCQHNDYVKFLTVWG